MGAVRGAVTVAPSLRKQAARGVVLIGVLKAIGTVIGRVSAVILPFYLLPYDFGLFALASVFHGALWLVGDFGISTELVRRRARVEEAARTAFTLQLGLALGMVGVSVIVGWTAAIAYRDPNLALPIVVLSLSMVFQSLGMVPRVMATRNLDFARAAVPDNVGKFSGAFLTIGLAIVGFAYWSPVLGAVFAIALAAILQIVVSRWKPRLELQPELAREIARFGRFVTLAALTNFLAHSLDDAIVGAFLGVVPLGYYAFAASWGLYFPGNISSVLTSVSYPVFSRVAETPERLRRAFGENVRYYSYVAVWIGLGVIVLAPTFVVALYDPLWIPAIVPMQALAPAGILLGYGALCADALNAVGRPRDVFRIYLYEVALLLVLIPLATVGFGLLGTSLAMTAGAAFLSIGLGALVGPMIGIGPGDWRGLLWPPLVAGVGAAVAGGLLTLALPPTLAALVIAFAGFSVVYAGALQVLTRGRFVRELRDGFRQAFR